MEKTMKTGQCLKPGDVLALAQKSGVFIPNSKDAKSWFRKWLKLRGVLMSLATERMADYFNRNPEILSHLFSCGESSDVICKSAAEKSGYKNLQEMESDLLLVASAWTRAVKIEISKGMKKTEFGKKEALFVSFEAI